MATETQVPPTADPAADAPPAAGARLSRGRKAWNFVKGIFSDKTFRLSTTGAKKGAILAVEGMMGLAYLLTLPFIIQPVAVVACCALIGVGLSGVRYGLGQTWRKLESLSTRFLHVNPLGTVREQVGRRVKKMRDSPTVTGLRAFGERIEERVTESPRFRSMMQKPLMKKILASRPAAFLRTGATPKQQELLLAGLTVQGSLVTLGFIGYKVATHVGVLPLLTFGGGVLTAGVAAYLVGSNAYSVFCGARAIGKHLFPHRRKDRAPAPKAAPAREGRPVSALGGKGIAASFKSVCRAKPAAVPKAAPAPRLDPPAPPKPA